MAVNKKYYYMRVKENFFDTEEMVLLEAMPEGVLYSNILIKMYLKSLKTEGRLMFKETIPYSPQMIATITRHQIGTVEKALQIFEQLGLIEVLHDGAIYMNDIELFIGESSTEAERKKAARARIEKEKQMMLEEGGQTSGQMSDKCLPELERKKETELYLDSEQKAQKKEVQQIELLEEIEQVEKPKEKKTSKLESQCKEIQDRYNSHEVLYNKRRSIGMSPKRIKLLKKFIDIYSFEEVIKAMDNAAKVNDWMLSQTFFDFNWIFKEEENFEAILNGKYIDNYNTNSQKNIANLQTVTADDLFRDC